MLRYGLIKMFVAVLLLTLASNFGLSDFWTIPRDVKGVSNTELELQWNQTYGGANDEEAFSVLQTADGGFVIAGYTESYGAGYWDMWLVKTNAQGKAQWNQTYGGTGLDSVHSVLQTPDGGFILAGVTNSHGAGLEDMWLVKTDPSGVAQWNQSYGGSSKDRAWSISQTADGGFVLAGTTYSYGAGGWDMWLVRTNDQGVVQWDQTYGGSGDDFARSVLQTANGGFVLAGSTGSYGIDSSDMWLVKTDANGMTQWNQSYGGLRRDRAWSVFQTADDGFVLAGYTDSYGAGYWDMWLVKTDSSGVAQWNKSYGGPVIDRAWSAFQMDDGGFVLAGSTETSLGGYDIWPVKTDAQGVVQWDQSYGGLKRDVANSVHQTADGGFVLAGTTESFGAGGYDMWLVKISAKKDSNGASGLGILSFLVAVLIISLSYRRKNRIDSQIQIRMSN